MTNSELNQKQNTNELSASNEGPRSTLPADTTGDSLESVPATDEIPLPILKPQWLHPTGAPVVVVDGSSDSNYFSLGTTEGLVKVLEAVKGDVVFEFQNRNDMFGISCLGFSPDSTKIAFGTEDGWVKIFSFLENRDDGVELFSFRFEKTIVENLLWSFDSSFILVSAGKSLKKLTVETKEVFDFADEESTITALRWVDRKIFALTCYCHLKLVESHTGKLRQDFRWRGSLLSMEICPNQKYVVCGTQENTIHIWNLVTKTDLEMRGFTQKIKQLSFREDGLAMAHGAIADLIVWDFSGKGPAGKSPQVLGPHGMPISEVKFQNQGRALVTAGKDGVILFWKPEESENPVAITGIRDQEINTIVWSKDDSKLFAGFATGYAAMIPANI